jgi:hypothetical protein
MLPIRFIAALSLLVPMVASCGPGRNEFAPACPIPAVPKQLSDLARYRSPSRDFRDLIIRAHISDVRGTCEPGDDRNTVVATAVAVIDVTRGPALTGNGYDIPLFVAVTDASAVLDKFTTAMRIDFPENTDTARFLSQPVRMVLHVSPEKTAAAYGVIAGFQLTPEEVAAWRRDNPR